jgi:subtilisin family serine protease
VAKYEQDHRIFHLEPVLIPDFKTTKFTERDLETHNQWNLRQLSNQLIYNTTLLSGFKLMLEYTTYGYVGVEYTTVNHRIVIMSKQNKVLHNLKLYSYELSLTDFAGRFERGVVSYIYTANSCPYPLDTDVFVGYDVINDNLALSLVEKDNFIPLYTVKIKLHDDPVTMYYTNNWNGVVGFYDLKQLPATADIYRSTVNGAGVDIVVGDCQLNVFASDIAGRASIAFNAYAGRYTEEYGAWDTNNSLIDQHGTACAHAAAGTICGVANKSKITGVTCLDISEDRGNNSDSMNAGLGYIVEYIIQKKALAAPNPYPVVVNLSIGTSNNSVSLAADSAVASMVNEGAVVCIAGGNDNQVHNSSPWSASTILVGASTEGILPCSFSNYGPHIDIYAPGEDIFSTVLGYERWQGTSVASPHVAGLCALYLNLYPEATPAEVKRALKDLAVEALTYNKESTTYLFAQNPNKGFIDKQQINTAVLVEQLIYTAIPYYINFDGEKSYGSMQELTLNSLTSAVVSAGQTESIDLATAIRLVK